MTSIRITTHQIPSKYAAFTLLESLISLIIISIVLAFAFPNLSSILRQNRMDAVITELSSALSLARSEAIKRGVGVSLCSSNNGTSCTASTDNTDKTTVGWQYGWLLFADSNADATVGNSDSLIRVYRNPSSEFTLIGNTYVSSKIHYLPTGRITVLGGTITVCSHNPTQLGKNIVLIATGRFRIDTEIECGTQ